MDSIMDELIKRFTEEKENFLFELFEKHGFNRDKVWELAKAGRICITEIPTSHVGNREAYCIDGLEIFRIDFVVTCDDKKCKMTFTYKEVM